MYGMARDVLAQSFRRGDTSGTGATCDTVAHKVVDLICRKDAVAILTKPAALSPEDRAIIKEHPRTGFLKLCRRPDLTRGQLMMVYQHHERIDGKGYPTGQVGAEIHDWGRICAVVDVYEAYDKQPPVPPRPGSRRSFRNHDPRRRPRI